MYGIIIAFKDYSMRQGILGSPWIGFENFERLFSSYWFPIILKNTLTLSILTLILGFPIPIILALVLNEVKNRISDDFLRAALYFHGSFMRNADVVFESVFGSDQ